MKKPTQNQAAVLRAVADNQPIASPVVRATIRKCEGVAERSLTTTIASCIDRGWLVVPQVGWEAYSLTELGRAALEATHAAR